MSEAESGSTAERTRPRDTGEAEPRRENAEGHADGLTAIAGRAIAVAAWAPSAHNTQPWVPRIEAPEAGALTVTVAIDPERTLPLADPLHMDTFLGMGCWVEAFAIACREDGADVVLTAVEGKGAQAVISLGVSLERPRHSQPPVGPRPLTARDVTARQVDRGKLRPDEAALGAAIAEYLALRPDAPAAASPTIRIVPETPWQDMNARAALHIAQSPAMLRETLDWLRLDRADPRWHEDGLTAECLRIPGPAAAALGKVLDSPVGRFAVRSAGSWQPVLERVLVGQRHLPRLRRRTTAGGPPTRIVVGTPAGTPAGISATVAGVTAREWIALGRQLMRFWLVLHRHGLHVNVQSEVKDAPANAGALARMLRGGVPFATFSVGRSTSDVPRAPRRPTGAVEL